MDYENLTFIKEARAYLEYENGPIEAQMGPYLQVDGCVFYLHGRRLWRLTPSIDMPLVISLEKVFK